TQCANNLKQIGLAVHQFANLHNGDFPKVWHESEKEESWIFTLAPHLESVDEIRICPDDPLFRERLEAKESSYVFNSYLVLCTRSKPGKDESIRNLYKLPQTHRTMMVFEATAAAVFTFDHVDAHYWFSEENLKYNSENQAVWKAVRGEVAVD